MKKYLLLAVIGLFGSIGLTSAAFQQQGFSQFKENTDGTINFWCEQSCVILLGNKGGNDFVKVQGGSYEGNGQWGYGYLLGSQVYAATIVPVNNYEWSFSDDPIVKQLPEGENQVVFLVAGPLKAENIKVTMGGRALGESISWGWKRFWKTEWLAPYSINLHYGPYVGGLSWPLFALVITLIGVAIAYVVRRKMKLSDLLYTAVSIMLVVIVLGGVRLLIDDIRIVHKGYNEFSAVADDERKFGELGDYIVVTDKVRQALDLDNVDAWRGKTCTIYAKSNMSWPFDAHWASVYLRPCTVVKTGSLADYGLYYNVQPVDATGTNIISGFNFNFYNFRP